MPRPTTAILHYTAPPIIGGVEVVIQAHIQAFARAGYPVTMIAGRGEAEALADRADFVHVPEIDSRHPRILEMGAQLEQGQVPSDMDEMVKELVEELGPILEPFDNVILHNVMTIYFNLPLTAALFRLLDQGIPTHFIAWCHDITWTSPHSRSRVRPGTPWDLLRTYRPEVTYVVVSQERQRQLAEVMEIPQEKIQVIYNGVDPRAMLGLSPQGTDLVERLDLLAGDLVLLMPVRVTQAKNIEFAMEVVAALKSSGIDPRLVLTGPPDPHDTESMGYFRTLQDRRHELGVGDEMHFVFELGPEPDEGLTIGPEIVGELYRVADLMFMPSHREGFAMPVLEAGLVGRPVVCTAVPAAREIGGPDLILIEKGEGPDKVARRILDWAESSPVHRLRRRVRQNYTWQAIFDRQIRPLLHGPSGPEGDS